MKTRTRKAFDINRVREFCSLINTGKTPTEALRLMNSSNGYMTPLKNAGLYWTEKDGTFKAVERIHTERYQLFEIEKINYNRIMKGTPVAKQKTLFCQPKQTTTTNAPTMKAKKRQLNFIQRVVKSLFKL
jgi:hypothetical protein